LEAQEEKAHVPIQLAYKKTGMYFAETKDPCWEQNSQIPIQNVIFKPIYLNI